MIDLNPSRKLAARSRAVFLLVLPLMAGWLAASAPAQTLTTLHAFTAFDEPYRTNSDGGVPVAGVLLSGNILYGTAQFGGSSGNGTVFAVNTDGTGFANLHNFTPTLGPLSTNSDGGSPNGGLILSSNALYGTAFNGGIWGNGTVFAVNIDGTGFTNLYSFTASDPVTGSNLDGANPQAGLLLSGNTLYGTANAGGSSGAGTVFAVNTDGTGFTNLYDFTDGSDGAFPSGGLILSSNTLYGTASAGGGSGSPGSGTVFALNTNGTGFITLHSFTPTSGPLSSNSDGAHPYDGLIISGNTLYGTASAGDSTGQGTLFAVNTDGSGFANLHNFTGGSDGVNPQPGLLLLGNTLYGTTGYGSTNGSGTVFALNLDGTGFTNLHSFTVGGYDAQSRYTNSGGAYPNGGLILSGDTLYGAASGGGSSGNGTVFSLSFAPQLTITFSGAYPVLTWPTNYAGFNYNGFVLQYTTGLSSPAVWINLAERPVVVNAQYSVTVPRTLFLIHNSASFRLMGP